MVKSVAMYDAQITFKQAAQLEPVAKSVSQKTPAGSRQTPVNVNAPLEGF